MSQAQVTFEIEGVKEVAAMFDTAGKRAGSMREPMTRIREMMLKTFDMNFASHGKVLGEPWKPRRMGRPWPMLERTGLMRHSFTGRVGGDYVELYNTQNYFKFHQSNKPRSTNLARRVMMKIDEERRRNIIKELQMHIMGSK
jgi:phage gpG-like protein